MVKHRVRRNTLRAAVRTNGGSSKYVHKDQCARKRRRLPRANRPHRLKIEVLHLYLRRQLQQT